MTLKPSPVSTRQFTRVSHDGQNLLVAEASSLPPFGRVYDDACDEGLTLVSERTGREVVFAVSREVRNNESELLYWVLRSADPADRDVDVTLHVFND